MERQRASIFPLMASRAVAFDGVQNPEAAIRLLARAKEETGGGVEAFELMAQHAREAGGNAVVGMRYDATEIAQAVAEVLAYGTAVVVEVDRA